MPKPLIEIVWICRCCGSDIREPHAPDCRFAYKPMREDMREALEAKGTQDAGDVSSARGPI